MLSLATSQMTLQMVPDSFSSQHKAGIGEVYASSPQQEVSWVAVGKAEFKAVMGAP